MLDLGTRKGGAQRGSQAFQRFDRYRSPSRTSAALKRRVVVVMLVVLSLMMITIYFREAPTGGLHTAQEMGATVLRPFQVGAERVAQPFRDVYGWFADLFRARSENERLRRELAATRRLAIQSRAAVLEIRELSAALEYRRQAAYPQDYDPIAAAVIAYPAQFGQSISIAAGSSDGVRLDDPVVSPSGDLVGRVTQLSPRTAKVLLLTDGSSAVSAEDVETGARGVALAGRLGSGSLVLGLVKKRDVVNEGDTIITAGSEQSGRFGSFYPRDIPIGRVSFVSQADTDLYKRVQIDPFVDFDAIRTVQVLVRAERRP